MKRVYLEKVQQYDRVFYIGRYDPRKLVKMTDDIAIGDVQEAQRPLEKKHLQEIADYVGDDSRGLLPASIMISTKDRHKLVVKEITLDIDGETRTIYYMDFPDTEEELEDYRSSIDVIDGQHRLFSFREDFRSIKDSAAYDIAFSIFICPSLRTRQELFTVTNEKQKAVNANLLMYLKRKLNMLSEAETRYYPLVERLAKENASPLKDRIIMSAERISKGYKAKELIKIFNKCKLANITIDNPPRPITEDELFGALCTYLEAWEAYHRLSFMHPGKETMTKISGLRYIFLLFEVFVENAKNSHEVFNEEYIKKTIKALVECKGLGEDESVFDNKLSFRGEGATISLASVDAEALKAYLESKRTAGYNPFA